MNDPGDQNVHGSKGRTSAPSDPAQGGLFDPPPYQSHSPTSREAAESMEGSPSDTAREKVLGYIRDHGPCTDEAVQDGLAMNGSTQRPRRVELHRAGLIRHAGDMPTKSGRLAAAWEVSP